MVKRSSNNRYVKEDSPWLLHAIGIDSFNVYSYCMTFWHNVNYQMHPDDIIFELSKHSNTADFLHCRKTQTKYIGTIENNYNRKNVPKNWKLHVYSAIQIVLKGE